MPCLDVSEERRPNMRDRNYYFVRLGFYRTWMDDIAEKGAISKGVLYGYFTSKDAIIAALLEHFCVIELRGLDVLQDTALAPIERLRTLT